MYAGFAQAPSLLSLLSLLSLCLSLGNLFRREPANQVRSDVKDKRDVRDNGRRALGKLSWSLFPVRAGHSAQAPSLLSLLSLCQSLGNLFRREPANQVRRDVKDKRDVRDNGRRVSGKLSWSLFPVRAGHFPQAPSLLSLLSLLSLCQSNLKVKVPAVPDVLGTGTWNRTGGIKNQGTEVESPRCLASTRMHFTRPARGQCGSRGS